MSRYSFGITVDASFPDTIDHVTSALADQGFGVLTTIDVQATLASKLGVERSPYVILGACNPPLAHQALEAEPDAGALLPCNVFVRQDKAGVYVGFMDPQAVLGLVENDGIEPLAAEVRRRLELVRDALAG
ncbi:MAG: DUF302 domain-containing protein [Acidimicrobiia bacterium]|jgi:uncharacterized protein (DUF302 family)